MTVWLYIHTKQERDMNLLEENFLCTRRKFGFNKKIRTKSTLPPQQKKLHNHTTVLYTKYLRNTKNYFPTEPKNYLTQTTTVWYSKHYISSM